MSEAYIVHKKNFSNDLVFFIAIHSLSNLHIPALGGCRIVFTDDEDYCYSLSIKLASTMQKKMQHHQLPFAGGKAVIMTKTKIFDRTQVFKAFAQFVQSLQGLYITAVDSGTNQQDMSIISSLTSFVINPDPKAYIETNPSFYTALGAYNVIRACVDFDKKSFSQTRIHIQGAGETGSRLAKMLETDDADIQISDRDSDKSCLFEKARFLNISSFYHSQCDIFSPCAVAPVPKDALIQMQCSYIIGTANNPLTDESLSYVQQNSNDLCYIPDYFSNAGGVIFATLSYLGEKEKNIFAAIDKFYDHSLRFLEKKDSGQVNRFNIDHLEEQQA
jgi:leucine dehydrogenase